MSLQVAKHAKAAAGKRLTGDYGRGFLTSGLFAYSRHPNFFAGESSDGQAAAFCTSRHVLLSAPTKFTPYSLLAPINPTEQAFWASIYLFGVAASGSWIHWSGLGVLQLIALFHFSTNLTEDITARKYSK